jgi:hypothetical protein
MPSPTQRDRAPALTPDEVRQILGDIDDAKLIDILALRPTVAELEEAAVWATGNGDILGKEGKPLAGIAAAIVDILTADEEEEPPRVH